MQNDDNATPSAEPAVEESPTSRLPKVRPSTSMAGRRTSMLPQPKRAISGTVAEGTGPGAGRSMSRTGGRNPSRAGGRTSIGLALGTPRGEAGVQGWK